MTKVSIDWQHCFPDSKPNLNAANSSIIPIYPQAGGTGPVVGLLTLTGSEGATNVEVNSQGNSSGRSGMCTVTLVSIDGGPYRFKIKNSSFWPSADAVQVTAEVSVERGRVQVWLEDPKGNRIAQSVKQGQSVELNGAADMTAIGDERSFSIYFEPQGDAKHAENVQAEIHYDMP